MQFYLKKLTFFILVAFTTVSFNVSAASFPLGSTLKYSITSVTPQRTSANSFKANISVYKTGQTTDQMNLIFCIYNSKGVLKSVTTFTRYLSVGETRRFSADYNYGGSGVYYIKAFIFENYKTIRPLSPSTGNIITVS